MPRKFTPVDNTIADVERQTRDTLDQIRAENTAAPMASPGDTYLTLNRLSHKLGGRSRSALYLDLKAGRLPQPIKLGGRLYWIEREVDEHLRDLRDHVEP